MPGAGDDPPPARPPEFPDFKAFLVQGPVQEERKPSRWVEVGVFRSRVDSSGRPFLHGRVTLDGQAFVLKLYPLKSSKA